MAAHALCSLACRCACRSHFGHGSCGRGRFRGGASAFLPANVLVAFVFVPFYVLALLLAGLSCMGLHVSLLGAVADALYALMAGGASMLSAPAAVALDVWGVVAAYVFLALMSLAIKRSRRSFWGTGSDYDSF